MKTMWTFAALFAGLVLAAGCGQKPAETPDDGKAKPVAKGDAPKPAPKDPSAEDGGEWCNPHGLTEAECSMCDSDVAKKFKAKGDWCDKHDRAKSQCFICDPDLMEKAKAKYKAKTGKEMPLPKKNMPEKK